MKKQTITLSEAQLNNLICEATMQYLRENDMEEGWFGNMFKAGGQQIANKTTRAVNDFSQRFNTMNAQDASAQADTMDKEVEALPAQIKAQVKQYRSGLMKELNQKVREFESKLKGELANKQTAATNMRNKANNYQNKADAAADKLAAADKERYAHRSGAQQIGQVAESKLDKAIRKAISESLNKIA